MPGQLGVFAALDDLVSALRDTGEVRADVDAAKLNPPCVWVSVGLVSPDVLDGNGRVQAVLYAIAPDTSYPAVVKALDGLLYAIDETVDIEGDVTPQSVVLPGNASQTYPAVRVSTWLPYERTETP